MWGMGGSDEKICVLETLHTYTGHCIVVHQNKVNAFSPPTFSLPAFMSPRQQTLQYRRAKPASKKWTDGTGESRMRFVPRVLKSCDEKRSDLHEK